MNKQDAIERIKKISEYPATYPCAIVRTPNAIEVIKSINEPQINDEQAWNKIAEAYPETVQSLRITLDHAVFGHKDELQKVKVPQFVADWFEEHKHDLSNSLWEFTVELNEKTKVMGSLSEFESWFIEHQRAYEFMTSMGKGYEVEEEPKWIVRVKEMFFMNWGEDGTCPTFVIDDNPGAKRLAKPFIKSEAQSLAESLHGSIEKV